MYENLSVEKNGMQIQEEKLMTVIEQNGISDGAQRHCGLTKGHYDA